MFTHEQIFRLLSVVLIGLFLGTTVSQLKEEVVETQEDGFLHDLRAVEQANHINTQETPVFSIEKNNLRAKLTKKLQASDVLSETSK